MEFSSFVITNKGQSLMAKLMQGTGVADFKNIRLSSTVYQASQLAALTSLTNVKQTAPVTKKTLVNSTAIQIEGAVDNKSLSTGYNINTIGLYAQDPNEGEILYAVAIAKTAGYMPPFNGVTVSGGYFKFLVTVGNASQVTLTVDPAGYPLTLTSSLPEMILPFSAHGSTAKRIPNSRAGQRNWLQGDSPLPSMTICA